MRTSALVASLFAAGAYAQQQNITYLTGVLNALTANNLTSLAAIAAMINSTTLGEKLLAELPSLNVTIFAPSNDAFAAVPSSVSNDTDLLADIIAYHVVIGNYSGVAASAPNVTIARSALNDPAFVNLEGNKSQVVVWTKQSNGTIQVLDQPAPVSVLASVNYQNIDVVVIDTVLSIPGNITTLLTADNNLTSLAGVVTSIPGLVTGVEDLKGFTLFAPNDDALTAAQSALASIGSNTTLLTTIIQNHLINGTSYYSTDISTSANLTSAAGESLTFVSNSSGTYVVSGGGVASAKIVKTNVLASNGVVHVIDAVLANTASDPSAASSAYASATSIAAQTATSTAGSSSTSSSSKSGAVSFGVQGGAIVGAALSVIAALLGAVSVL